MASPDQAATNMSTGPCPSSPSTSPNASSIQSSSIVTNTRISGQPTPVTETMSPVEWVRAHIAPLPSEPTPELQTFFGSCNKDITSAVISRAQVLLEKIFSIDRARKSEEGRGTTLQLRDVRWVEKRRLEATKLYYRVLSAMCRAEGFGSKRLTAVLPIESFHLSMIACSAELVLYTHKTDTRFSTVLETIGISAFDFRRAFLLFLAYEEGLPKELLTHLESMEGQILESLAWEKGSSMYTTLMVAKPHLAPAIIQSRMMAPLSWCGKSLILQEQFALSVLQGMLCLCVVSHQRWWSNAPRCALCPWLVKF